MYITLVQRAWICDVLVWLAKSKVLTYKCRHLAGKPTYAKKEGFRVAWSMIRLVEKARH